MRMIINVSMVIACSVFSLQAMLCEQAARLVAASVFRIPVQSRLLSGTPSIRSYDDKYSWRDFAMLGGKEAWDSVYRKPTSASQSTLLAQLTFRYQSDCYQSDSVAEFADDDDCKIARLFNGVAYIKRASEALKLSDLRFYTPSHGADIVRKMHVKERYPLVAAAETLHALDDDITAIIPQIQNVVPLVLEIKQLQSHQKVIRDILDAIKGEPQWVDQSLAAYICEDISYIRQRLQKD